MVDDILTAQCPKCNTETQIHSDWIGKEGECPSCGIVFKIEKTISSTDIHMVNHNHCSSQKSALHNVKSVKYNNTKIILLKYLFICSLILLPIAGIYLFNRLELS